MLALWDDFGITVDPAWRDSDADWQTLADRFIKTCADPEDDA